ncbi:MBL fold metallo-hydrolase [Glacieibacterium sp.]|uniref:MBL fold metallo-hydrolase n=1 Tax=Glacieibacterium sp. TaxID=2860237 RepID=UPI003B00BEEC
MTAGRAPRRLLALVLAITGTTAILMLSRVYYQGPVSDHFNGRHFENPEGEYGTGGARKPGPEQLLDDVTGKNRRSWPRSIPVNLTVPARRVDGKAMRITWIGHATALIQTQGLNILLDPVWVKRDSPVQFDGPRRVRAPGVRLEDLPRIDVVLISHNHYDHLDMATLATLWQRDRPVVVTGLGNDELLRRHGIVAAARDWGGRVALRPGIEVIVERAHHWSGRWLLDRNRTLWCGFTVTLPGGNIFYAGDTGPARMQWADAAATRGPIRLAVLPIGAFKPGRAESGNHISPVEAVAAFRRLKAAYAFGVHWGTFELTNEGVNEPRDVLAATLASQDIPAARFRTTEPGVPVDIPSLPRPVGATGA